MKLKFILSFLFILILLFSLIFLSIGQDRFNFAKNLIPVELKNVIKNTFFKSRVLAYEKKLLEDENQYLLNSLLYFYDDYPSIVPINREVINEYIITKYGFPSFKRKYFGSKSIGYLASFENKIFFITGRGNFYFFDENNLNNENINLNKINVNYFTNVKVQNVNEESIRDMAIIDGFVYVTLNLEIKQNCYNTSILKSKLDLKVLNFNKFFVSDECIMKDTPEFEMMQSGGKILKIDSDNILFTTGEYRNRTLAQDVKSIFGKTIKINLTNPNEYEIYSLGHRNQQGLNIIDNYILSAEHGPKGGDEVNLITNKNQNFGWPISSYGLHYDGTDKPEAPLFKSHANYGFVEPIIYFENAIAPSQLIKNYFSNEDNIISFLLCSLKAKKIFFINYDKENNSSTIIKELNIGERIRDIIYIDNLKSYILLLENTPAIAILRKN